MKLRDISINNLRRRKGKVFFLVLGLTIGITTVVALISITRTIQPGSRLGLEEEESNRAGKKRPFSFLDPPCDLD